MSKLVNELDTLVTAADVLVVACQVMIDLLVSGKEMTS